MNGKPWVSGLEAKIEVKETCVGTDDDTCSFNLSESLCSARYNESTDSLNASNSTAISDSKLKQPTRQPKTSSFNRKSALSEFSPLGKGYAPEHKLKIISMIDSLAFNAFS